MQFKFFAHVKVVKSNNNAQILLDHFGQSVEKAQANKINKMFIKSRVIIGLAILLVFCWPLLADARSADLELAETTFLNKMISRGKTLIKSLPKFTMKLAGSVKNLIPSPETIFNVSKQTLIGLPQEVIAYAVHAVCSTAVHVNAISPMYVPHVRDLNFELLTPNKENITIPLLDPEALWLHPKFQQDWNVVLMITGWNSNINESNEALDTLYAAYAQRNTNFVVNLKWNPFEQDACVFERSFCHRMFV